MPAGSLLRQLHTSVLLNIKQTLLHNKWHYISQVQHVTCHRLPICYIRTHARTHSKIETCLLSLSVKLCPSLVMIFFMNAEISFPVTCYNGNIYVLVSNLMALHQEMIPVVTWTLPRDVIKRRQVSWLQAVLDCMALTKRRFSQNTCPVWHRVISNQWHETAYCVWKCTSEEAVIMYWRQDRNRDDTVIGILTPPTCAMTPTPFIR